MKNILCPTDFTKSSENALLYAADLARIYKSKIILMHAYETPVIYTDVATSSGTTRTIRKLWRRK